MLADLGRILSRRHLISPYLLLILGLTAITCTHAPFMQVFGVVCAAVAGISIFIHLKFHILRRLAERRNEELSRYIENALESGNYRYDFQPFVCLNTHKITGAEMLLRMNDAEGKPISPLKVVEVSKNSGKCIDLLESALEKARDLKDKSLPTNVSINIEPCLFRDWENTAYVLSLIGRFQSMNDFVMFELTETPENFDINHLDSGVRRIRELGFKVWIDDLGTGQNSLRLWSLIEVDGVKLDRSFRKSLYGEHGQDWLRHIGEFCRCLEMSCVVEGIETKEEADIITELGFAVVQGFYFYRPMREEAFFNLVETGQARDCASCTERCSHAGRNQNLPGNDIALTWI